MDINIAKDFVLSADDIKYIPYSLPGFSGDFEAALINTNIKMSPFIALLKMKPGASILKHYHPRLIEAVYVAEGEMINGDNPALLKAGSFLIHGTGISHGPHKTVNGCVLMFIQYPTVIPENGAFEVGPTDSIFTEGQPNS